MRRLGAKSITALVIPEREVAWQILALNTEKAHNLKERSLEVIRIYRGLIDEDGSRPESGFAFYLDQAALVTLGVCYERVTRFGGGAYHPILRRLEDFSDESLRSALKQHEKRATMVLELEEKVAAVVKKLKERGLVSPYLRSFVVARINPLRWIKGEPPPLEDVLKTMRERVAKFNVEKIKSQDLAGAAGPVVRQNVTNWKPFFPACCVRPLMRDSLLRPDVTPIRGLGPRRELAHEVLVGRLRVGPIDRVVGG
jgi:ParB family chromosome partitioning protein